MPIDWVEADFHQPTPARAVTTLLGGGISEGAYRSANFSHTVGDQDHAVDENRRRLRTQFQLPSEPVWLTQVHGTDVWCGLNRPNTTADASVTSERSTVLAVLTADCLPVVLVSACGQFRGIAHAGWRGLLAGVIENTVNQLVALGATDLMAWLGPCIGPHSFEVGPEVRDAFIGQSARNQIAFTPCDHGKYLADLQSLARVRLASFSIDSRACARDTRTDLDCYSFRRQNPTGRMATVVWLPQR